MLDLLRFSIEAEMRQHHRARQNRAHRVGDVLAGNLRGGTVHWFEHRRASGTNVAAGSHAETALERGGQVGDDVAKHVVGDDHVERARFAYHLQAERVHKHVLRLDFGKFFRDLLEHALPQTAGKSHDVGLVRHQHLLAAVRARILEGEADDAFHAATRVDVLLCGDFVGGPQLEVAAHIGVHTLGVLPDDRKVDVASCDVLQRAQRSVEQAYGTDIGVKVHLEAHAQQDFFGVDVGGHARIAQRADEDGVEIAGQHLEAVGWNRAAVRKVAVRAPVEAGELHWRAAGTDHFDGVGDHFLADAIPGNNCNALVLRHGRRRYHRLRLSGEAGQWHHAPHVFVPIFGGLNVHLQQDEVRVFDSFGEPQLVARVPQLFCFDMVAHRLGAAGNGNVALAAGIGVGEIHARIAFDCLHFLTVVAAEKPDRAAAINSRSCHGTTVQTPVGPDGSKHRVVDAFDQVV